VLGGVPVLVPEPANWCATYRDAALAALAEDGHAEGATRVLDAFAEAAPATDQERFSDDWTHWEAKGRPAPHLVEGPAQDALSELRRIARVQAPALWLEHRTPEKGVVLEIGCGASELTLGLARRSKLLVVADLSLAAVLHARRRHARARNVRFVVADAQALPVKALSLDAVVAEHVIDLLDEPGALLLSAHDALKRNGRLLLASPAPDLGVPEDEGEAIKAVAEETGFSVADEADGLPWLRLHSARFVQVYLTQALELKKEPKPA
jgi:SAM-dependent methyltransferase